MKTAYLKKSESHLISARLLLDNDLYEQAVSMAYYSMYYSVLALFFATGIKCENHTAAIILLNEIFSIDNSDLEHAKSERIDKQYYVTSVPVRDDVVALIQTAETFNATLLDAIDRLTNEKIQKYRKKFQMLI
ncbi:MAG TPA: HEPN domain-containing protein [Methanoregula sp.]|nr:HEPN domain-containing protein [Methanoregula sp.]